MGVNAQWLLLEQLLLVGLALLLSVLLARALGPEEFGTLSFVLSIVALCLPLAGSGLSALIVKQITIGTTNRFAWVFGGAILSFVSAVVFGLILVTGILKFSDSIEVGTITAILCLRLVTVCLLPFSYAFQSDLKSGWVVLGRAVGALSALTLAGAVFSVGLNLKVAALILVVEPVVSGLVFLASFVWFYRNEKKNWLPGLALVLQVGRSSLPLILAGVALTVYVKADIFMLGLLGPRSEVGLYSVAARVSGAMAMLPSVIAAATFPVFVKILAGSDESAIQRASQLLFDVTVGTAMALSFLLFVFSDVLIVILFGAEYAPAIAILKIHVFSVCMIGAGLARSRLLIAIGEHRILVYTSVIGAVTNVLLNLMLIPRFGGEGAAIATVVSYTVAVYFSCLIFRKSRRAFKYATLAFLLPFRVFLMAGRQLTKIGSQAKE